MWDDLRALAYSLWVGQRTVDPKLTYLDEQWQNLAGLVAVNPVEKNSFARLGDDRGTTYFLTAFPLWLNDEKMRYHWARGWLLVENRHLDAKYLALDDEIGRQFGQ